jgi:hypothetical protein
MRLRIPLLGVFVLAVAAALGTAGVIWATNGGGSVGDTASLVPADASVYVSVSTDPASRQWIQFSRLLDRLGVEDRLRDVRDDGLLFADIDWDEDLAPYLGGEATFALTGTGGDSPEVLVVVSTRDGGRAWDHATRLLDDRADENGTRPLSRTYRGVTVRTYAEAGEELWIARRDRYLLFGSDAAQAEQVIDLASGKGQALAGLERFRAARGAVNADALFFVYANPRALGDGAAGLGAVLPALAGVPASGGADALQAAGLDNAAVAFALTAEKTGLRMEWQAVGLDTARMPVKLTAAPDESRLAKRAPADTLLFVAGADLYGSVIRGALESFERLGSGQGPFGSGGLEELRAELRRELGFDVEKELIARLTGEYALAIGAEDVDQDSVWLLAMSGVDDAAAVKRAMEKLDAYGRREGRRVSTSAAGNLQIVESRARNSGPDVYAYTVAGDELIAGSNAATVRLALSGKSLADEAEYREAMAALPDGRALTLFVNLTRLVAMAREPLDAAGPEWQGLEQLRFLAAAVTQKDDRSGGVAFLRIGGE